MQKQQQISLGLTRIVAVALIAGVVIMSGAMYFMASSGAPTPTVNQRMKYILLAAAGAMALMSVVVPRALVRGITLKQAAAKWAARKDQEGGVRDVVGCFAAYAIFSLGMTEAWGLLGAVGYMMTRDAAMLAIPGACVLFLAAKFPGEDKWRDYFRDATGQDPPDEVK